MFTDERFCILEGEVERLGRRLTCLEEGSAPAADRQDAPAPAVAERSRRAAAVPARQRWRPPAEAQPRPAAPAAPVRAAAPAAPAAPVKTAPSRPAPVPAPRAPQRYSSKSAQPPVKQPRSPRRTPGELLGGRSIEDLLGGSVLAWVGGLAVLIGVAFLFAVAISRGWIDEAGRTLIAGAGSTALLTLGIWLHEKRARTDAALAAVATGVSALFVTFTVAAQVYELIPSALALAAILGVGSLATGLAVRWESRGIAALGIVGGLVSPVLSGAPYDFGTMAILMVAGGSAVGVLLRQRWSWLASAVFAVTIPQWVIFLFNDPSVVEALAVLVGFGLVGAAAAVGYEVRAGAKTLRPFSAFLLALNAVVLSLAGWYALGQLDHETVGRLWLAGLALAHLSIGVAATRSRLAAHDFGLLAMTIGVVIADVAFALSVHGPARTVGFAGAGVLFAALVRHRRGQANDESLAALGLGTHLALSLMQVLVSDAPVSLIEQGGILATGSAASLVAIVAACFVSGRLAEAGRPDLRLALDAVGLAVLAYLTALTLDGTALAVAWSVQAVVLARIARPAADPIALVGAYAHLGLAIMQGLVHVALPEAVQIGDVDALQALGALGAAALAAFACARLVPETEDEDAMRGALDGVGLAMVVYLAAAVLDGAVLAGALAAGAVALAEIGRRLGYRIAVVGSVSYLALAAVQVLVNVVPPEAVVQGPAEPLVALGALAAVCLAAFASARLCERLRNRLDVAGLVALAYLLAVMLEGAPLVLAFAVVAVALTELTRRSPGEPAGYAALAFVGMAAGHVLAIEAPPTSLVGGVQWPLAACAALAATVLAGISCARVEWSDPLLRRAIAGATAVAALYAASVMVVTPFQPGTAAAEASVLELGVRQHGQVLLSALWTVAGFGALIVGLRRDLRAVRLGALTLLLFTVGKVFLYDLAALTSIYRVISFIGLGLMLLAAAFTWQRMRPRDLPDMRETPKGIR